MGIAIVKKPAFKGPWVCRTNSRLVFLMDSSIESAILIMDYKYGNAITIMVLSWEFNAILVCKPVKISKTSLVLDVENFSQAGNLLWYCRTKSWLVLNSILAVLHSAGT